MTFQATRNGSGIPRLGELAIAKLLSLSLLVEDIGDCPFHIVKPILGRMSAKQLTALESCCPQITPELDVLWVSLIEKDFPNRPSSSRDLSGRNLRAAPSFMPHKSLYQQYGADRDALQKDSTERLRRVTERFYLQKAANKVVAVAQHLQDPTVRRRHSEYHTARSPIFLKAKRDLQARMRTFRGQRTPSSFHSPVTRSLASPPRTRTAIESQAPLVHRDATKPPRIDTTKSLKSDTPRSFKSPNSNPTAPSSTKLTAPHSRGHQSTTIDVSSADESKRGPSSPQATENTPIVIGDDDASNVQQSSSVGAQEESCSTETSVPTNPPALPHRPRKRKAQPSIFLIPKRRPVAPARPPAKPPIKPRITSRQEISPPPPPLPSRMKAIRSSIFN